MFFYILLIYSKDIIITPYNDKSKHLVILNGKVRISPSHNETNDIFKINDLDENDGFFVLKQGKYKICGKIEDPGVVACTNQEGRKKFTFVEKEDYVNIVNKNGKCLTVKGEDNQFGGNFLNLKNCDDSMEQKFKKYNLILTDDEKKDETYITNVL